VVNVENGKILADSGEGYVNRGDMLKGFFSIMFAQYDESFLELYNEWNPPEAQDNVGVPTPDSIANDTPPPVEEQAGTEPKPDGLTDSSV
jgi:hypothetical protein